jgi:hypothetical protein
MANDPGSLGFFAAEVLENAARLQPHKTAVISKDEEITFAEVNRRVHTLVCLSTQIFLALTNIFTMV